MILIVDSGSTKSDWVAIESTQPAPFSKTRTKGLNPAILSKNQLETIIHDNEELISAKELVSELYFYGAGCGTEKAKLSLFSVLEEIFTNATIYIYEDTMAAVYATINALNEKAIVCILGTGSNCSYYNGSALEQRVVSLGYTLMDEASGNYFGKQLLRDYFYKKMPESDRNAFEQAYDMSPDVIKDKLYRESSPNAYLASLATFLITNKNSYKKSLIKSGIRLFITNHILQYKELLETVPVHFAGSVAYFCQDEIKAVAKEFNIIIGNFERRPIDGLKRFHVLNAEANS